MLRVTGNTNNGHTVIIGRGRLVMAVGNTFFKRETRFMRISFPTDGMAMADGSLHMCQQRVFGDIQELVMLPVIRHVKYHLFIIRMIVCRCQGDILIRSTDAMCKFQRRITGAQHKDPTRLRQFVIGRVGISIITDNSVSPYYI